MAGIKIYSKGNDPYSDMLKNMLKYHSIEFENIEVNNKETKRELLEVSGQENTPVLIVDDKVFVGFDRIKIKEVLGIKD